MHRLRLHFPCSPLEELRELFGGDMLFFKSDSGGGGGDDSGAQGGDGDDDDDAHGGDDDDGAQGGDGDDSSDALSAEDARKLRSEARNLRKRLKDAEKTLSAKERAELDEAEALKKDVEERDKRLSTLESRNHDLRVRVAATEVGIRPKAATAAAALVDWDTVDTDDDKAVADALKALKKEHEYLFTVDDEGKKPADIDGGKKGSGDAKPNVRPGIGTLREAYSKN